MRTVARTRCPSALLLGLLPLLICTGPRLSAQEAAPPWSGELLAGGDFDYAPYEWVDSSGRPRGFHIDLISAIAETRDLKVRFRLGPWPQVRKALEEGRIHLVPMFRSPDRERVVDFCDPHAILNHVIVVRRGTPVVDALENLKGRRILVQNRSFIHDKLRETEGGAEIQLAETEQNVLRLLDSGRADCAVVTQLAAEETIESLGLSGRLAVGAPILPTEYCMAVRKGDDALRREISLGLAEVRADGRLEALRRRWFGRGYRLSDLLPYVAWIVAPIVLVAVGGMIWNRSLRAQISVKTRALTEELARREEAEGEVRGLNRDLERRVRDRTLQLENANRELEAFSASASHDLRAPLRHVEGYVDMLDSHLGTALDEKAREYVDTIRSSAGRMRNLIEDLLKFARTARAELNLRRTDMGALVEEARKETAKEAAGRAVDWKVGDLPAVSADASLVRQVWVNLISNALKFSRSRDRAVIEIRAEEKGGEIVFSIRDNGVGFDMANARNIFKEFQRFHSPEAYEGTGVGLALVDRIVRRHGGRVWAESAPGRGATFSFTLGAKEEDS